MNEPDSDQVSCLRHLACKYHSFETRRDGFTPYIVHCFDVARRLKESGANIFTIATGFGHDIVESNVMVSTTVLRNCGVHPEVIQAIYTLTKRPGQDYMDYLMGVKLNSIALKVKIADILSNLSDHPTEKQIKKYGAALKFLME